MQPLFHQIAELIEDSIADGQLNEGDRVWSTNELAVFHGVNAATARKGLALLADAHLITKQRGIGMFVAHGAREAIRARREKDFAGDYLAPLVDEAVRLELTRSQVHELLDQVAESRGFYNG